MPDTNTPTTFLRLLTADDKAAAMRAAVAAINIASPAADVYTVDPAAFRQIPGSPFAYWISETIRSTFTRFDSIRQTPSIDVERGGTTMEDTRYLRLWWEVDAFNIACSRDHTIQEKQWVTFIKGGVYSRYYRDWELTIDWLRDGETLKDEISKYRARHGWGNQWTAALNGHSFYFRPGITWPRRTLSGLNVRVMPSGCIFADKGPTIFYKDNDEKRLFALLALVNSSSFRTLLALQVPSSSFEVGFMQRMPIPAIHGNSEGVLNTLAREAHDLKRMADRDDEVAHPFTAPALVRLRAAGSLANALEGLAVENAARERRLAEIQREIDDRCFALYGFSDEDRAQVLGNASAGANSNGEADAGADNGNGNGDEADETDAPEADESARPQGAALATRIAADLLMYAVGCAFGRWDARIGRDSSLAPNLAEPFAPLPVCAPGTLVGTDGLPATAAESIVSEEWLRARPNTITLPEAGTVVAPTIAAGEYPIPVAWEGILVDDPDAQDDIVRRVRATLDYLWGERADAIEREACAMLGVQDLRDYLRHPRGFFDFHISRYSKSRRKAPIYWLLQSPKRQYGIWLSYHRFDADLVFKALNFHLLPKIRLAEQRLTELETIRKAAGTTGSEARRAAQAVERQEALLADLREFYAALDRAARHYLKPDLNDGVLLNIAPFWEVVPWKEAKSAWQRLLAGTYEWSSIGKQMREKGLVKG